MLDPSPARRPARDVRAPTSSPVSTPRALETAMAGKTRGGREVRKPKAEQNKKTKGQTPSATAPALDSINHTGRPKK